MYIYEDPWLLKASQPMRQAHNSPVINVFIQQHVQASAWPLSSNCPFEEAVVLFLSGTHVVFVYSVADNNGATISIPQGRGGMCDLKVYINRNFI